MSWSVSCTLPLFRAEGSPCDSPRPTGWVSPTTHDRGLKGRKTRTPLSTSRSILSHSPLSKHLPFSIFHFPFSIAHLSLFHLNLTLDRQDRKNKRRMPSILSLPLVVGVLNPMISQTLTRIVCAHSFAFAIYLAVFGGAFAEPPAPRNHRKRELRRAEFPPGGAAITADRAVLHELEGTLEVRHSDELMGGLGSWTTPPPVASPLYRFHRIRKGCVAENCVWIRSIPGHVRWQGGEFLPRFRKKK